MGNDLVERLRSAMCPGSERCNVLTCYPDCECGAMEAAAARITELQRELAEAREAALEEAAQHFDKVHPDSKWIGMAIRDLRRAARAYANKGEPT